MKDMREGPLSLWTVYDHPSDFPGCFVAREFLVDREVQATGNHFTAPTLEAIREQLPPGLFRIGRQEKDDPVIVETWI